MVRHPISSLRTPRSTLFGSTTLIALVSLLSGCPEAPCCTSDAECNTGTACIAGECTYPCQSNADCVEDELCIRPEGAASTFGVCLLQSHTAGEQICRDRLPLPVRDAGGAEPEVSPEPGPEEPEPPPPCAADTFEPNNDRNTGTVAPGSTSGLTICSGDEDWYLFPLDVGDALRVRINFDHALGDLDLALFSPEPFSTQLATSTSTNDFEEVTTIATERGVYAVRAFGFGGASNRYQMVVVVVPNVTLDGGTPDAGIDAGPIDAGPLDGGPPGCRDDAFEPNDSAGAASPVLDVADLESLTMCVRDGRADQDNFLLLIPIPSSIEVTPTGRVDGMVLELRTPSGALVAVGSGEEGIRSATPDVGVFLLTVIAAPSDRNYGLGVVLEAGIFDGGSPVDAGVCDRGVDEPNDVPGDARVVPAGIPVQGRFCPFDEDWYAVDLAEGETLTVTVVEGSALVFVHEGGPDFSPLQFSSNGELVFFAERGGRYFLRMTSAVEDDYTFIIRRSLIELDAGVPDAGPIDAGFCPEDVFEPNNSQARARTIAPGVLSANICAGDEDFFQFFANEGQLVLLQLQVNAAGLRLQLFGPDGFIAEDSASVGQDAQLVATLPTSGTHFIRVFTGPDTETDYDLQFQLLGDPGCVSDALEPNDERSSPAPAPVGEEIALEICEDDRDFFFVDLNAGDELLAVITFSGGNGSTDLDMRLYGPEPNGTQLDASSSISSSETVSTIAAQDGRYVIEVFGFGGATNEYILRTVVNEGVCENDLFEPNNRRADAFFLPNNEFALEGQICPNDVDFFEAFLNAGSEVQLTYAPGQTFRLRIDSPGSMVQQSTGAGGFEALTASIDDLYTIRVDSQGPAAFEGQAYQLQGIAGSGCQEDMFEPNDSFATATPLVAPVSITASFCDNSLDMFRVQTDVGAFYDLVFIGGAPGTSLALINESTFSFQTVNDGDILSFDATSSSYLIVITGDFDFENYIFDLIQVP